MRRLAATIALVCLGLGGCGFEPVYADRSAGLDTVEVLQLVSVETPVGRQGDDLRAAIEDRLNPEGVALEPRYRLVVEVQSLAEPFVIEPDGTASRFNIRLTAPYRLISLASNQPVIAGTVRQQVSYNVSETDDYATFISQNDAIKRGNRQVAESLALRVAAALNKGIGR